MATHITLKELRDIIQQELRSVKEDLVKGGLSDHMSVKDVAKKHDVPVEQIIAQVKKGVEIEKEHTDSIKLAAEIALDHLVEDPNYYDKLAKIEDPTKHEVLDKEFWRAVKHIKPKPVTRKKPPSIKKKK